jgi:hypothetical protein
MVRKYKPMDTLDSLKWEFQKNQNWDKAYKKEIAAKYGMKYS